MTQPNEQPDDQPPDAPEVSRRLAAERETTLRRMAGLGDTYDGIVESSRDVATDDEHDPEGQTIAYERAQVSMLLGQGHDHLRELDAALARLENGTYGGCAVCGQPIGVGRLEARPAVTTCIGCASAVRR